MSPGVRHAPARARISAVKLGRGGVWSVAARRHLLVTFDHGLTSLYQGRRAGAARCRRGQVGETLVEASDTAIGEDDDCDGVGGGGDDDLLVVLLQVGFLPPVLDLGYGVDLLEVILSVKLTFGLEVKLVEFGPDVL